MTRPMQAYRIYDGNSQHFVRGTTDPDVALRVLLESGEYDDLLPEADEGYDLEPEPDVADAGLYRFNVQAEGSDYGWMLGRASKPGRGVFPGVELDIIWRPVEFESDEVLDA